MTKSTCSIDGCERPRAGRGWCQTHWLRWRKHGNPLTVLPPRGPARVDPWDRIDQSQGQDCCWPWTGCTDPDGYGVFKIDGRNWRAPRWVLGQKLGRELTADEITRHACDNPTCCNPAHLLPGTPADNTADMIRRGRAITGDRHWARRVGGLSGARNGAARLDEESVREIRRTYAAGATQIQLASRFGVSQATVSQIIRRKTWTHLGEVA